jgi:hypothetical protein
VSALSDEEQQKNGMAEGVDQLSDGEGSVSGLFDTSFAIPSFYTRADCCNVTSRSRGRSRGSPGQKR